jgi:Zonular occludens toxin (Zot)
VCLIWLVGVEGGEANKELPQRGGVCLGAHSERRRMIVMVTGPPGNGKSYYALRKLAQALESGKPVATNVELAPDFAATIAKSNPVRRLLHRTERAAERIDRQAYVSTEPDGLAELFNLRLRGKGEGRGVMVLDEAHGWLNARDWSGKGRGDVVRFFSQHRKLGWDVFLIVQDAEMIDRQVRALIEYHVILRNLKRAKVPLLGIPFAPVNMFLALWTWHGTHRAVVRREVFRLGWQRRLYDTHQTHHGLDGQAPDDVVWLPRPAPESVRAPAAQRADDVPDAHGQVGDTGRLDDDAQARPVGVGGHPARVPDRIRAARADGTRPSNSRVPAKNGRNRSDPDAVVLRPAPSGG